MLSAWIDTSDGNYPCLPPDYKTCLKWEMFELIFSIVDRVAPKISDMILLQGLNKRLGTTGLGMKELLYHAGTTIRPEDIAPLPEQDSWVYNTTRYGKPAVGRSMVCDVFVCANWKVAGIFDEIGSRVNCGEFTNWDAYSLNIFEDPNNRPQICKDKDPDNTNCQMMGKYKLRLNNYNSRPMHPGMAEHCGGVNPTYDRGVAC